MALQSSSLRHNRGFLLLLAFLIARFALVAIPARNPQGGILIDSEHYVSLAAALAAQGGYTDPAGQDFIWPAGYPLFIALASGWSTPNPILVSVAQLLLTDIVALLLVAFGTKIGYGKASLAAGWIYAVLPTAALWALTVMSETLFAVLLLLACMVWWSTVQRAELRLGVLAGLLLGLAAFVRPIGLILVPMWALLVFLAVRRQSGWRRGVALGVAIAIGAALVVLPWSLRNLSAHGKFAFSGVGERTFFNFNMAQVKAEAEGTTRDQAAGELGTSASDLEDSLRIIARYPRAFALEQGKGLFRTLLGLEAGSWARLLGYPEALRSGLGIVSSFLDGELALAVSRVRSVMADPQTGPILMLALVAEMLTILLYALTAVLLIRGGAKGNWGAILLIWTIVALVAVPGAAGQARFRIPIEPLLAILAAGGWTLLLRRGRDRGASA